jgi:hypothetical protein
VAKEGLAATTGSVERVTVTRTVLDFLVDFAAVLLAALVGFLACCFSLLAAIAGAPTSVPMANNAAKIKSQNRFKRIPKYLPKLSTYGMIINFLGKVLLFALIKVIHTTK